MVWPNNKWASLADNSEQTLEDDRSARLGILELQREQARTEGVARLWAVGSTRPSRPWSCANRQNTWMRRAVSHRCAKSLLCGSGVARALLAHTAAPLGLRIEGKACVIIALCPHRLARQLHKITSVETRKILCFVCFEPELSHSATASVVHVEL